MTSNFKSEIKKQTESLWILAIDDNASQDQRLCPIMEAIDWYNNHLVTKSLLKSKVPTEFGQKFMIKTNGLISAEKIVTFGLGNKENLNPSEGRKFLKQVSELLQDLNEKNPWIVVDKDLPKTFITEIQKSRTSFPGLEQATISLG